MKPLTQIAAASALFISVAAHAFPIAAPGTEGFLVIASGGDVIATYQGNSAGYSNDLYLVNTNTFVFNNHANNPGDTFDLGVFSSGTELEFRLHVNNTGDDFYSGPAARNPDLLAHARVQNNWQPGETLVSFEDLLNEPEGASGFNDLSFSFTNTESHGVPEPASGALMLAGLGIATLLRRRQQK